MVIGHLLNFKMNFKSRLTYDIISGFVFNSVLISIGAFYVPINNSMLYCITLYNILLVVFNIDVFKKLCSELNHKFNSKYGLFVFLFLIVFSAYSTANSKINDDGLYYTQTIKWFREFGFVHGISNLHVSLGLSSSWHILQSLYIFSESIYTNDLNGFIMLVYVIYIIEKLIEKSLTTFSIIQFLFVLIISIPFYTAPNPDFAIIVLTSIAIDVFLSKDNFTFIILIGIFSFTIKISAIFILFLCLYCLFKQYKTVLSNNYLMITLVSMVLILILKNIYQTAYPFYPLKFFSINILDWKTPEPIIDYFLHGIKTWAYSDNLKFDNVQLQYNTSYLEITNRMLNRVGAKGLINWIILLTIIGSIFLLVKQIIIKKVKEPFVILFAICFINIIIWFLYAPQFRFILPVIIYLLAWILSYILDFVLFKSRVDKVAPIIMLLLPLLLSIPFILGTNFKIYNSKSSEIGEIEQITLSKLVFPSKQYQFDSITSIVINNTTFSHPKNNRYCWNVNVPCMSVGYEQMLCSTFRCKISLRNDKLNNGFLLIKY